MPRPLQFFLLMLLALLVFEESHAQSLQRDSIRSFSGRLMDSETKDGLPFAMLKVKGGAFGTVSNISGEFELKYPLSSLDDTLQLSMVGYHSREIPLLQLQAAFDSMVDEKGDSGSSLLRIFMTPNPIKLAEVTIHPDEPPAKELMKRALERIEENYPSSPFLLHGFFRDIKIEGEECAFLLEAAVRIYDKKYYRAPKILRDLQERVAIDKMRSSQNFISNKGWKAALARENSLTELLANNMVRYQYGPFSLGSETEYERLDETRLDSQLLYVVSVPDYPDTEIYIDSETYGIQKFVYNSKEEQKMGEVAAGVERVVTSQQIQFEFQPYQGKLFLKYIFSNSKFEERDIKTAKVLHEYEIRLSLVITDIVTDDVQRIPGSETMGKYQDLETQLSTYDEHFWDRYNTWKENPVDQKLIDDLEEKSKAKRVFQRGRNKLK